eukprot:scaffold141426_cov33-Tisochrysis_lutea.AAC.2
MATPSAPSASALAISTPRRTPPSRMSCEGWGGAKIELTVKSERWGWGPWCAARECFAVMARALERGYAAQHDKRIASDLTNATHPPVCLVLQPLE